MLKLAQLLGQLGVFLTRRAPGEARGGNHGPGTVARGAQPAEEGLAVGAELLEGHDLRRRRR
jgi:hypothetical protein